MPCTKAYKAHIMYTFNGFCKTVICFEAVNAWRGRSRRRQKEIIFLYFFEHDTQREVGEMYGRVSNPQDFTVPEQRIGDAFTWGIRTFCPMKRLVRTARVEPEAVDEVLRYYSK